MRAAAVQVKHRCTYICITKHTLRWRHHLYSCHLLQWCIQAMVFRTLNIYFVHYSSAFVTNLQDVYVGYLHESFKSKTEIDRCSDQLQWLSTSKWVAAKDIKYDIS